QLAALSASSDEAPRLFQKALAGVGAGESKGRVSLFRQICSVIGVRKRSGEVQEVLSKVAGATNADATWWRAASLEGLSQGTRGERTGLDAQRPLLMKIFESPEAPVRRAALQLLDRVGLPPGAKTEEAARRAAAI